MKLVKKDEYEKLSDERRFCISDFSIPSMSFQPGSSSDVLRKGLEFTSVKDGKLFEDFAAQMIRNNYVDLKRLTDFFSIKIVTSQYGIAYDKVRHTSDRFILDAFNALTENTHIRVIHFDHLKLSKEIAEVLLKSITVNSRLPLNELFLNSIIRKHRSSRNEGADENWLLAYLVEYLPRILATRKFMGHLSIVSNRLGLSASGAQLITISQAIASCRFLHTLNLKNNKFSFQQAMLVLKVIETNNSIISLELDCDTKSPEEKAQLKMTISSFLKKNCDKRDVLRDAIANANYESVKGLFEGGGMALYCINGMSCTQYTHSLIANMQVKVAKLRSKLNSQLRLSFKANERADLVKAFDLKIEKLESIYAYLKEQISENLEKTVPQLF